MTTVQELAKLFANLFVYDTRDNGTKFVKTIDNHDSNLTELIHAAHGSMLPDDHKYEFIYQSLGLIADASDSELDYLEDQIEADIWNSDRLEWLSSNLDRPGYVNEYVEDYLGSIDGSDFDLMEIIGQGQWLEKCEVLRSVLASLQELVEEIEDEEDEELDEDEDLEEE